jgi:hypothetical protein
LLISTRKSGFERYTRMGSLSAHIETKSTHRETHVLYPMKVWLTALFLVAPFCLWLKNSIAHGDFRISANDLGTGVLLGLAGSILSLPVYGILFLTFRMLTRKNVPARYVKWILDTLCVLGIFVTFKLIDETPDLITALCYSFSVIIASLLYKIYMPSTH